MALANDRLRPFRVLVGFADAIAAPEAAWSLADAGFLVSTFSRAGRRVALTRSSAVEQKLDVTPPERDAEATVRDLQRIAGTGAFDAVLPLDDQAIWTCARAFAGSTVTVVGPSGALADLALDKREQLEIAEAAGFQCFPTTVVTEPADAATHPPFPVVVKPALAAELHGKRLSRGKMSVCANESELAAALAQRSGVAPDLLQPYRSGHGEGLFGLATAHGPIVWSGHRRIRMMNPTGSGSSACFSIRPDADLVRAGEAFITKAHWTGPFMIELLRDADGTPYFVEFNGRLWGSLALSNHQGFDYAAWSVQAALDPNFSPTPPATFEHVVCRHLGRELAHLAFVFRGPRSEALAPGWPGRWQTLRDVAAVRRTDRWYNLRARNPTVLAADTVLTLTGLVKRAG